MPPSSPRQDSEWWLERGEAPRLTWHFKPTVPITCCSYARESGDFYFADENGNLTWLDHAGNILAVAELEQTIRQISWSDDGSRGAVVAGNRSVLRITRDLKIEQSIKFKEDCLSIAVPPFGNQLAVSLADSTTHIYSDRKRKVAQFETVRPLAFLEFCSTEPVLFGAADHGFVACFNLAGALIWKSNGSSNIGQLSATGSGDLIYLASFLHGIQALDGEGTLLGTYVLDGTVRCIATSFEPHRLMAATVERSVFWLDASGELIWEATAPEEATSVFCDPLGTWGICCCPRVGIFRFDWSE